MNTDEHGFSACKQNAETLRTQGNVKFFDRLSDSQRSPRLCVNLESLSSIFLSVSIRVHPWFNRLVYKSAAIFIDAAWAGLVFDKREP